jgi:hypothetical protein
MSEKQQFQRDKMNLRDYQKTLENPLFYQGSSANPVHKMLKIPTYVIKIAHIICSKEQKENAAKNLKHLIHFDEKEKKLFAVLQTMAHNYIHKEQLSDSFMLTKYELSPNLLLPYGAPTLDPEPEKSRPSTVAHSSTAQQLVPMKKKKKTNKEKKRKTPKKQTVESLERKIDFNFEKETSSSEGTEEEVKIYRVSADEEEEPARFVRESDEANRISPVNLPIDLSDALFNFEQRNEAGEIQTLETSPSSSSPDEDNEDEDDAEDDSVENNIFYEFTSRLKSTSLSPKALQKILENPHLSFVDQIVQICEEYEGLIDQMRENYDSVIQATNLKVYIQGTKLEKAQEKLRKYEG